MLAFSFLQTLCPLPYVQEMKHVLYPTPPTCVSRKCSCTTCENRIFMKNIDEFSEEELLYCSSDCEDYEIMPEIYEAYVDYILDCDYDW